LYGEVRNHKKDSKKGSTEEGKENKEIREWGDLNPPIFRLWIPKNVFS
jgi:hypothetical protein